MINSRIDTEIDGKLINSDEFYRKATAWANKVRALAKANTAAFTRGKSKPRIHTKNTKWHKRGDKENLLANAISYNIKEASGVVEGFKFIFPRHGIFRAYGVGSGQPISGGTGKNIKIKRSMSDWIDAPIDRNIEKLADISAEFYGDQFCISTYNAMKKQ